MVGIQNKRGGPQGPYSIAAIRQPILTVKTNEVSSERQMKQRQINNIIVRDKVTVSPRFLEKYIK